MKLRTNAHKVLVRSYERKLNDNERSKQYLSDVLFIAKLRATVKFLYESRKRKK